MKTADVADRLTTPLYPPPGREREEVDTALLQRGDVLGALGALSRRWIVLCGKTAADESMITGESMPVSKSPGDGVIGGTVNRSGMVLVLATGVGADSMLSKVVRLTRRAGGQGANPGVCRQGERGVCSSHRGHRDRYVGDMVLAGICGCTAEPRPDRCRG